MHNQSNLQNLFANKGGIHQSLPRWMRRSDDEGADCLFRRRAGIEIALLLNLIEIRMSLESEDVRKLEMS